jgi:hypothetical protein
MFSAAILYISAAPAGSRGTVPATVIQVDQLRHQTLHEHDLPPDDAVKAFGRLPPSLVQFL